jgi:hypothetical protein
MCTLQHELKTRIISISKLLAKTTYTDAITFFLKTGSTLALALALAPLQLNCNRTAPFINIPTYISYNPVNAA